MDVSYYEGLQYTELRSTIIKYLVSYQRAEDIEQMYKGLFNYLTKNHALENVAIPYFNLIGKKSNEYYSNANFAELNRLAPSECLSLYFNGNIDSSVNAMLKDLKETNAPSTCINKLCLLATFVFILAIFITIIKAKL